MENQIGVLAAGRFLDCCLSVCGCEAFCAAEWRPGRLWGQTVVWATAARIRIVGSATAARIRIVGPATAARIWIAVLVNLQAGSRQAAAAAATVAERGSSVGDSISSGCSRSSSSSTYRFPYRRKTGYVVVAVRCFCCLHVPIPLVPTSVG